MRVGGRERVKERGRGWVRGRGEGGKMRERGGREEEVREGEGRDGGR